MRRTHAQHGFSLAELTTVVAVVSILMLIVYATIDDAMKATMFAESHNDLTIMTQRVMNDLQSELLQSRLAFQDNADGNDYKGALQLPASVTVWSDTLLPVFQSGEVLTPDTGTGTSRRTGNSLLLVRQLEPLSVMYDDDGNAATPDVEFLADRYRFDYYYLASNSTRSFGGTGFYLDLLESRSGEYADYFQLASLSTSAMTAIVPKVQAAGISSAWDPGQPLASAFYDLAPAAKGAFGSALAKPTIPIARTTSLLPEMRGGRISGRMEYSIAFVPDSPKKPFPLLHPIGVYAQPDPAFPKFPAGFEVKIAGPSGNRRVGMRLVLMANYKTSTYESQQGFVTASGRF